MIFNKTMIAPSSSATSASLSDLVRAHDKRATRPNMMLKMDIEGSEWDVLAATSDEELARFTQIVCELHYFQGLAERNYRTMIFRGLPRIHNSFAAVHVHANNCGGFSNIANLMVPNVLELTFVNRSLYALEETDELFPGPMDISCNAYQPDMYLGSFRF